MMRTRLADITKHIALLAAVIALGLGLRTFGYSLGLPFTIVKYGGSLL